MNPVFALRPPAWGAAILAVTRPRIVQLPRNHPCSVARTPSSLPKTPPFRTDRRYLEGMTTTRKIRVVRFEGNRQVSRQIDFYNLEMIISVGYRVNSRRGVLFRRWATAVLKEYLLRGSVRDQRLSKLEKRMTAAERSIDAIVYTLIPPVTETRHKIGFDAAKRP